MANQNHYITVPPTSAEDFEKKIADATLAMGIEPDEIEINPMEPFFNNPQYYVTFNSYDRLAVSRDPFVPLGICWFYSNRAGLPTMPDAPRSDPYEPKTSCSHEWTNYTGLMESFEYCKACGNKKE